MAHDGTTLNGEAAALIRARVVKADGQTATSTPQWLIELKSTAAAMRERRERPAGKPFGRWLGDFLDQDTPSGLLPAEEKLLSAAAKGEACVLQARAVRLWTAFDEWRKTNPEAPPEETGFVASMAKFVGAAPRTVQEVIGEATRHAVAELRLPETWEPKEASEVEAFASAQRIYLSRLEAEANPAKTIGKARKSESFYQLAVEVVIQALTPKPYQPLKLSDESLNGLLRRDALGLSVETRAKIDAQPRLVREFFDDLVREVRHAQGGQQAFLPKLKADPAALKEQFEAAFVRYEREEWRQVDPEDPEVRLRAAFLRFLALGGDDAAPVHEKELYVKYAYVQEDLDLCGSLIPQPLWLAKCHFAGKVLLRDATTKSLDLAGCRVTLISAESANVRGSVYLRQGFRSVAGVNLDYAMIAGPLSFERSTLLSGGSFALRCERAKITAEVDLNNGFLGEGGVFFTGAKIGGDLNCAGGAFRNRKDDGSGAALSCDNAETTGNISLIDGFRSEGAVSFSGAKIGGTLDCSKGIFLNRTGDGAGQALNVGNAEIASGVSLRDGFSAEGQVRFYGAHVKGDFHCGGGRFENSVQAKKEGNLVWAPRIATALNLQGAKIDGTLWLGPPARDTRAAAKIFGSVKLGCVAWQVVDNPGCWPPKKVRAAGGRKLPTFIYLDGFSYDRFAYGDFDAATRKRWLDRQPSDHLGVSFRPQPFEQLIKVYREMGHEGHARAIAKFKERRRYQSLFIKLWHGWRSCPKLSQRIFGAKWGRFASPLNWLAWPLVLVTRALYRSIASIFLAMAWAFVGFGTAYWYGWGRLSVFLLALWIAGGFFYAEIAGQGGFAPSNPVIYLNEKLQAKCGKNWTACKGAPAELPSFSPFTYSLDIMLPLLDLGQKRDWQPIERAEHPVQLNFPTFTWLSVNDLHHSEIPEFDMKVQPLGEGTLDTIVRLQTLLSWGALGLLIAMLSGLIKRD